jgi:hypothetical protein
MMNELWFLIDRVFPCKQPLSKTERIAEAERGAATERENQDRVNAIPDDRLDRSLLSCRSLLASEDARRQSVDSRLTAILGLSSIAGTIVFGSMLAQSSRLSSGQGSLQRLLALGSLYLTLQVCSAIFAAVRGLGRRGYRVATAADVLPQSGETLIAHQRREISGCLEALSESYTQNNAKVTQMAIAHEAMKNFFVGLLAVALLGTWQALGSQPQDSLLERLRTDHALREMLRGPQGPPGIPGPKGDPGMPVTTQTPSKKRTARKQSP